jgi:single-strand DNA-binding protein
MVNKVILVGNLGRDPEVRHVGGQAVTLLRLATTHSWVDKRSGHRNEEREWHDIEVWGRYAELCVQYLAKGRQVYVAGRLKTDRWQDVQTGQDRQRVKVVAEFVRFLGNHGEHDATDGVPSSTALPGTPTTDGTGAGADEPPPMPLDAPPPTPPPDLDDLQRIP